MRFNITKRTKVMLASIYAFVSVTFTTAFMLIFPYWQLGSSVGVPLPIKVLGSVGLGVIAFFIGLYLTVTAMYSD